MDKHSYNLCSSAREFLPLPICHNFRDPLSSKWCLCKLHIQITLVNGMHWHGPQNECSQQASVRGLQQDACCCLSSPPLLPVTGHIFTDLTYCVFSFCSTLSAFSFFPSKRTKRPKTSFSKEETAFPQQGDAHALGMIFGSFWYSLFPGTNKLLLQSTGFLEETTMSSGHTRRQRFLEVCL